MSEKSTYSIYLGGELFNHKDLIGNVFLAEAIGEKSGYRYQCIIPQNLEQRETSPQNIRDQDLCTLLNCDLALFHYDGTDLDSGTVVEFIFAKFADIPSVILRTDYRSWSSDQANFPWNLMASFYPRTEVLVLDGISAYQEKFKFFEESDNRIVLKKKHGTQAATEMVDYLASLVVDAFDKVQEQAPILEEQKAATVYQWLAHMPGFQMGSQNAEKILLQALKNKRAKGIL